MTVIDERGRVFGRINLIDAAVTLLLFVLIPVAYGAYVLFRTPAARLMSVTPNQVYHGPNQHVEIHGVNLRPYMRVTFNGIQGLTFVINSTVSATVEVPDLPPGAYDVDLFDYKQEVDHLPHGLTVLSVAPVPTVDLEVSGSFKGLSVTSAREFQPGVKLTKGDITAEVLRVGAPAPSIFRMVAGTSVLSMPVAGQLELPASLRVRCSTEVAGDGTVRCMVPGPQHPAPVAPDSILALPGSQGWVNFQISTVALTAAPSVVTVRVQFAATPDVLAMVKVGDRRCGRGGLCERAPSEGGRRPWLQRGALDATLAVPAALGPTGWMYNNQPLKPGLPLRFETVGYVVTGQVTGLTPSAPSEPR